MRLTDGPAYVYNSIWNKYRPAILRMMLDAANEPQQYQLYAHEFHALSDRKRSRYSFTLRVSRGKAINNIRDSVIAHDLLNVLQLSRKATELMESDPYEIVLDGKFMLHINKLEGEALEP